MFLFLFIQCLAAGSHIANHAMESAEIRPYAITLTKIISELRSKLREEGAQYRELHFSYQVRHIIIMHYVIYHITWVRPFYHCHACSTPFSELSYANCP